MVAVFGLAAAALLIACHPPVNPVDPQATNYTGIPDGGGGGDPGATPEPILPSTAKWELVADHAPGRMLPLEITDDESFIEPRDAGWFELWITLSDSFDSEQTDGAILWVAAAFTGGSTFYTAFGFTDVIVSQRRLVIAFGFIPNESRIRLRLVDRNGTIIGERVVGHLVGDADGNGTVDPADNTAIAVLEGFAVSTDNPGTIRVDLDLNGIIEPNPGSDWSVVANPLYTGKTLPAAAAQFWD